MGGGGWEGLPYFYYGFLPNHRMKLLLLLYAMSDFLIIKKNRLFSLSLIGILGKVTSFDHPLLINTLPFRVR